MGFFLPSSFCAAFIDRFSQERDGYIELWDWHLLLLLVGFNGRLW